MSCSKRGAQQAPSNALAESSCYRQKGDWPHVQTRLLTDSGAPHKTQPQILSRMRTVGEKSFLNTGETRNF